jgi:hypothetical protein
MGFRDYDPGLNRFTTRDMYNGALADMGLGTDPFTGNRYAFTGGNPTSNVELDGHWFGLAAPALSLGPVGVALVAAVVIVAAVIYVATEVASDTSDDTSDESKEEEAPKPEPKPTPRGGPKDDTRTGGDCSEGSGGWVKHGDLDKKNGNRATGVTACLTESYLDTHEGTKTNPSVVAPPGYRWAQRAAGFLGAFPVRDNINACHLLGKQLGGSGTQLENLATCARGANAPQVGSRQGTNNMQNYENQVRAAVEAGQAVYYQVTPTYSGRRTVPIGFRISAYGTSPDGSTGIQIDAFVSNTLAGRNLGMFNDPKSGRQVPTGSTP